MAKDDTQPCKRCKTDLSDCMANRGKSRKPKLCCASCDHSPKVGMIASLFTSSKPPARKSACFHCGTKGQCSCGNVIGSGTAAVTICTQMCRGPAPKNSPCGKKMRGGVCPCPLC